MNHSHPRFWPLLAGLAAACGSDPTPSTETGTVQVYLEAEDAIPEGLTPGSDPESVVDGWAIQYDRFLIALGGFEASRSTQPSTKIEAPSLVVYDLTKTPVAGAALGTFPDVEAARFDRVGYQVQVPSAATQRDASAATEDFDRMVQNGWTHLISGSIAQGAQTIAFEFGITAKTRFSDCGPEEGDLGFAVTANGTSQLNLTIHGDHPWFNGFPGGVENVERRAEWLARADLNDDGQVTQEELSNASAATLFPSPDFSLSGSPIPINNGADWVRAQAYTIGHLQGEGECVWTVVP